MSDELVPQDDKSLLARPSHLEKYQGDKRGADHFTQDDLRLPRLTIAQKTSDQIEEGTPEFIEGLKFGDLFNDLSGEIYGRETLHFIIIRADRPRAMEFTPIDEGGGVVDFDVALSDPRCEWTTGDDGKRVKPIATVFYDYILLLVPSGEMIALSLKSTGLKAAKRLNSLISMRNMPVFTGLYELSIAIEKNDAGSYGVYVIKNAGWANEELAALGEKEFEKAKGRNLDIKREADDGVAHGDVIDGTPRKEDLPF